VSGTPRETVAAALARSLLLSASSPTRTRTAGAAGSSSGSLRRSLYEALRPDAGRAAALASAAALGARRPYPTITQALTGGVRPEGRR
jgi:hypothetical protein